MFLKAAELADEHAGPGDNPCLGFSLEIAGQLLFIMKYQAIAELYLAAYGSSLISELIVELATERNQRLFRRYNPAFSREDFYALALTIKGVLHSFIDEYVHHNKLEDGKRINSLLELILSLLNIPGGEIQDTIRATNEIIDST